MNDETKEIIQVVQEMFLDLKNDIKTVNERIGKIETSQQTQGTDLDEIKKRTVKIETSLENETNKNIKLLAEGYSPMAEDIHQLKDDMEVVKFDVDVVKKVVTTHSTEINQLRKAK